MSVDEAYGKMSPEQAHNFAVVLALFRLAQGVLAYTDDPFAPTESLGVAGALAENFMIICRDHRLDVPSVVRGFDWIVLNGIASLQTRNGERLASADAIGAVDETYRRIREWRGQISERRPK